MRLLVAALVTCAMPAAAADLTLHRVMLSAAGVGYFEFSAPIDGPGTVGLDVPLAQVDDVLASLAVFDDRGGVGSIELPGHDHTRQAFDDVPFTEAQLDTPRALLEALRGQRLAVAGPFPMEGSIVSSENEAVPVPALQRSGAFHTRVTLLTAEGFRQFILEDATSIRLTDPVLNAHIGAALLAVRQQTAAATRHLTLRTGGRSAAAGARTINVGYVAEAPLWKASYRVVLPQAGGDHARVQGWAVLENQSGVDWKAVDLTLQSGNPVTFHQAIYSSYFASRPEVPVEVLGRLLPDPDQQATVSIRPGSEEDAIPSQGAIAPTPPPPPSLNAPQEAPVIVQAQRRLSRYTAGPRAGAAAETAFAPGMAAPGQQTQATETPIDTSFHIATPIDLARGNSASVPILDQSIPAEQLDLLPAYSDRPITALRLTNTLSTSLPAGILTLYTTTLAQGAAFAGDARLSGLPAGQNRLLAFAEDLRTIATRSTSAEPDTIERVKLVDGVLTQSILHRTIMKVAITAPAHESRRVLVEFPKSPDAIFVLPQGNLPGQEETATAWRVKLDIKAGETYRLTAYADTSDTSVETLLPKDGDLDNSVLVSVLAEPTLDAVTRAKLQNLADLRAAEGSRSEALQKLTDERDAMNNDEQRLRANIQAVFNPGDLRDKLLAELAGDESELARLAEAIHSAQANVAQAHAALQEAARRLTF